MRLRAKLTNLHNSNHRDTEMNFIRVFVVIGSIQISGCALVQTDLKLTLDGWLQARIGAEGIKNHFVSNGYSVSLLSDEPLTLLASHYQHDCRIRLEFDGQQRLSRHQFLNGTPATCPSNNTSWRLQ
jgi:hypothetical protein